MRLIFLELRALICLATPLIIGQFSSAGVNLIDVVLAGRLDPAVLAAVAVGSSVWSIGTTSISGLMMALTASIAQLEGAKRRHETWGLFCQALRLALVSGCIVGGLLYLFGPMLLVWTGITQSIIQPASNFIRIVSFAAPAFALFCACRGFAEGLSLTIPTAVFSILGLALLGPVAYVLMYGRLGIPSLGATGSAVAVNIVMWCQSFGFFIFVLNNKFFQDTGRQNFWNSYHWPQIKELLIVGLPMSLTLLMEAGLFIIAALLIGKISEYTAAAHQIAMSVATIAFMFPLGLSMAITVRVGNAAGRNDLSGIRRSGFTGLCLTLIIQMISATFMLTIPTTIVNFYTSNNSVALMAVSLLQFAGFFQFSDGIQVASNGALRGIKDTKAPLIITSIAYWCVGMPAGWLLSFHFGMGAAGMWVGILAGLTTAAIILATRFIYKTRTSINMM